jgi:hypothetical protein
MGGDRHWIESQSDRRSNLSPYRNLKLSQMHSLISRNLQTYRIGYDRKASLKENRTPSSLA